FVIGIEIKLSNNHTLNGKHFEDICDTLQGTYPKTFKFVGWHPFCRCIAVPKLADEDEFIARQQALIDGNESDVQFSGVVTDMPENFKEWVRENADRIEGAQSKPYFIRDNRAEINEILNLGEDHKTALDTSLKLSAEERAFIEKWPQRKDDLLRVRNNPDYYGVEFNIENGGLKATHQQHNFDKDKGQYEKDVQDIAYKNGNSIILEKEYSNELYKRFTEGMWNGELFELATRETATDNNILRGLLHCCDKKQTEVAVLYFPKGGFSLEKIQRAIRRYKGYSKVGKKIVDFKRIICLTKEEIVYDETY
ncbi:MAG: hypothetical protein J1F05_08765, partial [Muribaculaceae bacterium]|nr:hypothetical protein [Muribaculaceae bacterium]